MGFLSQIVVFLLSSRHVYAEYGICENTVCATADLCAADCAAYAWGYNMVRFGCNSDYVASCICDSDGGHSSSMDQDISMCPTISSCGGSKDATQGMAIFSAYCNMNLNAAAVVATTTQANTGLNSSPTMTVGAGLTLSTPLATSTPTGTSSTSTTSSSNSTSSLSISDKIAIGCAIGGALVTIAVAVPTWRHKRNKKTQGADEAQPLHGPPEVLHPMYPYPAQQPFIPQPQPMPNYAFRPAQWGWQGYK